MTAVQREAATRRGESSGRVRPAPALSCSRHGASGSSLVGARASRGLLVGAGFLNYDTAYSAALGRRPRARSSCRTSTSRSRPPRTRWRRSSARSSTPVRRRAPRPLWVVIAFLALGALGWLTYELGAHWFGPAAGAVARSRSSPAPRAALRRARVRGHPVRRARARRDPGRGAAAEGRRAGARLARARRPAATRGVAVLARLRRLPVDARPRACCRWRRSRPPRPCLGRCTTSSSTGDPLHSLTGTRDNADVLERITGLQHVPSPSPRRLGEILREPGLLGAARAALLVLAFMRRRARAAARRRLRLARRVLRARRRRPADPRPLPAAARRAARGLLRRRRVRLARAARATTRGGRAGRRSARVVLRRRSPSSRRPRPTASRDLRGAIATQAEILADLHAITRRDVDAASRSRSRTTARCRTSRCGPASAPARDRLRAARAADRGAYLDPASERVLRNFTLDPHDPKRLTATCRPASTRAANRLGALRAVAAAVAQRAVDARLRALGAAKPAVTAKVDRAPSVEVGLRGLIRLTDSGRATPQRPPVTA